MLNTFYLTDIDGLYVIMLSILIGIEVIKNVPAVLHTPLMSGSNAISGIILIGGILQLLNTPKEEYLNIAIASLAILIGSINVAGGFFVTNRMLSMFSQSKNKKK